MVRMRSSRVKTLIYRALCYPIRPHYVNRWSLVPNDYRTCGDTPDADKRHRIVVAKHGNNLVAILGLETFDPMIRKYDRTRSDRNIRFDPVVIRAHRSASRIARQFPEAQRPVLPLEPDTRK